MSLVAAARLRTHLRLLPSPAPAAAAAALARTMSSKAPWYASLPEPKATVPQISAEELHALTAGGGGGKDWVVVDVRRADFDDEGQNWIHPNAINLPAHTLYQTRPTIFAALKGIPKVIFHCNSCKAGGRGPRSAGWYQDYLDEQGCKDSQAYVLAGGFKGYKAAYPGELVEVAVAK